MRAHGASRDREPEAEPGTVGASSLAEGLEQITFAVGNTAALIFDLDQEALALSLHP